MRDETIYVQHLRWVAEIEALTGLAVSLGRPAAAEVQVLMRDGTTGWCSAVMIGALLNLVPALADPHVCGSDVVCAEPGPGLRA